MVSRDSSDSHGQERHYPRSLIGGRAYGFSDSEASRGSREGL